MLPSESLLTCILLTHYKMFITHIGMHCLELAKTAWNASVQTNDVRERDALVASARSFLEFGRDSLRILGEEGDFDDSPLREADVLRELLE